VSDDLYAQMKQAVIDGEAEAAAALAQKGLDAGLPAVDILDEGFVKGIEEVGDLFGRGEFFLPELVQGAEAMKAAVEQAADPLGLVEALVVQELQVRRELHVDRPAQPAAEEFRVPVQSLDHFGRMLAAEPLESVSTATTVRMRNGKLSITDGPFAETKEQLAGFYLIEARDLNEALQVAGGIPAARVGSVEVRPVRQLNL